MSKKNGKPRHFNVLVKSDSSIIQGSFEMEDAFKDLCGSYHRIRGEQLPIPPTLDPDLLKWRTLVKRNRSGDFRHTEAELQSMKTVAQWMVDENARLRGVEPTKIDWGD
jgi:hypothetical protein